MCKEKLSSLYLEKGEPDKDSLFVCVCVCRSRSRDRERERERRRRRSRSSSKERRKSRSRSRDRERRRRHRSRSRSQSRPRREHSHRYTHLPTLPENTYTGTHADTFNCSDNLDMVMVCMCVSGHPGTVLTGGRSLVAPETESPESSEGHYPQSPLAQLPWELLCHLAMRTSFYPLTP